MKYSLVQYKLMKKEANIFKLYKKYKESLDYRWSSHRNYAKGKQSKLIEFKFVLGIFSNTELANKINIPLSMVSKAKSGASKKNE